VSPDGRWFVYTVLSAGQGGPGDVFMRPFPNVGGDRVQVTVSGGASPMWSSDGRAIYFLGPGRAGVWRVDVSSSGQLGTPVQLLAGERLGGGQQRDYVTSTGRMIRIRPIETSGKNNELRVVLNWFELLKQKMSGGRPSGS
jgi:hypothetical protein